jgi:eukaryotic-like serine/threonine-protein kinase
MPKEFPVPAPPGQPLQVPGFLDCHAFAWPVEYCSVPDPSDKQRPWRAVDRRAEESDAAIPPYVDDEAPTGMVSRQFLGSTAQDDLATQQQHALPESDGEHTVVDYRLSEQASLPYQDTDLVAAEPTVKSRRPRKPLPRPESDMEELLLDELQPLIDESTHYSDAGIQTSAPPPPSARGRAPMGKHKPALPLPAPPSKSEPVAAPKLGPSLPAPAPPRKLGPPPGVPADRLDLAGSYRNRAPQRPRAPSNPPIGPSPGHSIGHSLGHSIGHSLGHSLGPGVPMAVEEDHDRSTAVASDPLAPLRTPLIGGRYRIVGRIGAGGMGKVLKVTHAQLGKTFALKIISESIAGEDKIRELFYREARMASAMSHPNIASVVDFGEDRERGLFMVMELIEGEALAKRLHREKQLSIKLASDIIRQVAEALGYIHSKGIVHCDIKTENILLVELASTQQRRKIQVKLLDFGLAKSMVSGRNTTSLAGTPHYVAPERIRGAQPSPATDIYGLGILYYELLTGNVPWDGTVEQILHGHLNLQPVLPSKLVEGGLDPALEQLILRALAKTPAERHKDVAAFLYELQTVMDMLGYGRPGRRKRGTAKRVITRSNQRDETARALFDASRVPMALISREGAILVANPAFAQFIMGVSVDVEGLNVRTTPLVAAWATFEADLARACAGTSMRRTLELDVDHTRKRRLLMWLDPGLNEEQAMFGVHPLEER